MPARNHFAGQLPQRRRRVFRPAPPWAAVVLYLSWMIAGLRAQLRPIESAAPGLQEAGPPPINVVGAEPLGLDDLPTDLRVLPDGRILVFSPNQLVIGDGVRWQMLRQKEGTPEPTSERLAVDHDGAIYAAIPGGFARIVIDEHGLWEAKICAQPAPGAAADLSPETVQVFPDQWIWGGGSGPVVSWRPGQSPRIVGRSNNTSYAFEYDGGLYLCDNDTGSLLRAGAGGLEPVRPAGSYTPGDSITCSVPAPDGTVLLGTANKGVVVFDGRAVRPLPEAGVLSRRGRINDLCVSSPGVYVAAVENYGLVFFESSGRILQAIDSSLDNRVVRIKRLAVGSPGVVWALLETGVMQVQYPSRLSSYESLMGSGMLLGFPVRYEGRLWILADGSVFRADYAPDGRLTRLVPAAPEGKFVFALSVLGDRLVAGTSQGAFSWKDGRWESLAPEIVNLRALGLESPDGRWLYGAKDEIGWMRSGPGGAEFERLPVPGLGDIYGSLAGSDHQLWLELGSARLGRIRLEQGRLQVEQFGAKDGLPNPWIQAFSLEGQVEFNTAVDIFRFDEATRRFTVDEAFKRRFPQLANLVGRPGYDAAGRIWFTAPTGVHVLEKRGEQWHDVNLRLPPGLRPFFFTFETNGVVWLQGRRRMMRYDPGVPLPAEPPLRSLITHVTLAASDRTLFAVGRELPPLTHADNSMVAHFMSPGNVLTSPVTFEVMLEGGDAGWVSVGSAGSAVFNRLKEGSYVLHVRPRVGGQTGAPATLAFSVLPPWYRTPLAYLAYGLCGLGLVLTAAWLPSALHRRQKAHLEALVNQRTRELNESNARLALQVEEIKTLSQAIEQSPVAVRIERLDGTIEFANPRQSRTTGYAPAELIGMNSAALLAPDVPPVVRGEIAAALGRGESWHGHLVNRLKNGGTCHVRTTLSPIRRPGGDVQFRLVLEEDITDWLAEQRRRRELEEQLFQSQKLESLGTLAGGIAHDFNNILTGIMGFCELARFDLDQQSPVQEDLQRIYNAGLRARDLVKRILTFSRRGTTKLAAIDLAAPVAETINLVKASTPSTIEIVGQLENGTIMADATQIEQVALNLCTNAVHAMRDRSGRLTVSTRRVEVDAALAAAIPGLQPGAYMCLAVADTGHGMDAATLKRIFDPFFTTKNPGEGTGLGLAIVQGILNDHHGAVRVQSTPGAGTTFELYFPCTGAPAAPTAAVVAPRRGRMQEILVVDDEPTVTEFLKKRLRLAGYTTSVFNNSPEAFAAFEAYPGRYEAIITDFTMPLMTGIVLAQRVRASGSMIPIIIMTGFGSGGTVTGVERIPHCLLVEKPFVGDELMIALDKMLGSNE